MRSNTYALDSTWRPLLKDLGVPAGDVLRRAGLPQDLLTRPAVRLEAEAFHRFWMALEQTMADPLLPLRVCQAVRGEAFSPPLFAALCSPNFLVAVQRIARYKALVAPMQLRVTEGSPGVPTRARGGPDADGPAERCDASTRMTLELVWPDAKQPPPASLAVTELLFFVTLARMGTREPVRPLSVTTPVPPAPAAAYAEFLGVDFRRGPQHQIAFARTDVLRPFLTTNEGLWAAFEPELRTRLAELDAAVTVGQRVRAVLLEALPSGVGEMDEVCGKLAMSRRTLQRHLEAEGLSYAQVLQQTRHSLALHYLRRTELPAAEIAFLLGFEEPNSFYRAYRRWSGQTPEATRRQGG